MSKRDDLRYWNVPVTKVLDETVNKLIKDGLYETKAQFIRDAVRQKLKEMGLTWTASPSL